VNNNMTVSLAFMFDIELSTTSNESVAALTFTFFFLRVLRDGQSAPAANSRLDVENPFSRRRN